MNTGARISKPVLFAWAATIVILGLLLVVRHRLNEQPPQAKSESSPESTIAETNNDSPAAIPAVLSGELPPVIPISLADIFVPAENEQWQKNEPFVSMP